MNPANDTHFWHAPGRLSPRFGSRPLAVSAAGTVGVLVIHAMLVLSFVLSLSLPSAPPPKTTGAGASALVSAAEPEMTVVFIDEPSPVEKAVASTPPVLASRGTAPSDLPLVILSPDPSPAAPNAKTADSDDAPEDTVATQGAEHARLYGRYVGQVQARIERAWLRPRSEIGALRFGCRVRVRQDRHGDLVGIDLDQCNGSERWQQSLLDAIRTASPLPAPPDASVYADVLWLTFASGAFEPGGSTEGFEPETPTANGADAAALTAFHRFATSARDDTKQDDSDDSNVIHLTIIGNPAEHETPGHR